MKNVIVEVADCKLSNDPDAVLVTYALGSCVAVAVYDPVARIGGLLHLMLPDSALGPAKAAANPFLFADTGIQALVRQADNTGLQMSRALVGIAGGAQVVKSSSVFNIGRRNEESVRRILFTLGLKVHAVALGGCFPRTVWLDIGTGRLWMREEGTGLERRDLARADHPRTAA